MDNNSHCLFSVFVPLPWRGLLSLVSSYLICMGFLMKLAVSREQCDRWTMNLKWSERKWSWSNKDSTTRFAWRDSESQKGITHDSCVSLHTEIQHHKSTAFILVSKSPHAHQMVQSLSCCTQLIVLSAIPRDIFVNNIWAFVSSGCSHCDSCVMWKVSMVVSVGHLWWT
jgi:hypothetical protein